MNLEFAYSHWLLIAPIALIALMGLAHLFEHQKKKLSRVFSHANLNYSEASTLLRFIKWLSIALSVTFLCLSLSEPRYGVEIKEVSRTGRDIVFILDVSKSMLAKDMNGYSRLKRAQLDIAEGVSGMNGHRLGLIAFAGSPKDVCPLTYDYFYFQKRLRELSPASVAKGGTNIGDALRMAVDLIDSGAKLGHFKDIILITDGQDHEGYYEEIAKEAGELDVSIYTVGIGQANPSSIRLADGTYLQNEGQKVQTALDPEPLKMISRLSGDGFYQNLTNNPRWLKDILSTISQKEMNRLKSDKHERKITRYYYFLALALFFFALATLIPERKKELNK